jgi:hypothetical protein
MFSAADNELLTRTRPGTRMGEYFRRNWLPVALSRELPEPDGTPLGVHMLGEELLAFRDTQAPDCRQAAWRGRKGHGGPDARRFIASETVKWREIIARAGIKLDP